MYFVCLETPIFIFIWGEKPTEEVGGCPAPRRLTPEEANLFIAFLEQVFFPRYLIFYFFCLEM